MNYLLNLNIITRYLFLFLFKKSSKFFFFSLSCCILLTALPLCSCVKKTAAVNQNPTIPASQTSTKNTTKDKQTATPNTSKAVEDNTKQLASAEHKTVKNKKKSTKPGKAQKILETAYTQIGKMYRYGGTSPKTGFDCSGFTRWVFAQNGIGLPRSSGEQLHAGKHVSKKNLRPGDLLIYSRRIGRRRGTHVGIYVGDGKFIHSPHTGQRIQVSDAFDHYRTPRFIAARRIIDDPDAAPLPAKEQELLAEQALKRNKPKHEPPKLHENTFAESYKIYHVQRGDTISGLAKRFHVPMRKLLAANQLGKREVLQLDQRLMIPIPGGATGKIVKPGQSLPEVSNVVKHTVKSGESLGMLAQKYGVSSEDLARVNKLRSKHAIRSGQVLIIPVKHTNAAQPIEIVSKAEEEIIIAETIEPAAKEKSGKSHKATSSNKPEQTSEETILVAKTEVEEDILVAAPEQTTRYTVKSGDTIWEISKKFGLSESELLSANDLQKKHTLRLGQQLVIPQKNTGKRQKAATVKAESKSKGKTYVVKSGDTIWKIAKHHGLSEEQLLSANNLSKKHVLRPGQKLVIP